MKHHSRWIAALAMLLFSVVPVIAQATYGGLSGTVRDQSGAVVTGAAILVENEGTAKEFATQSNGEGVFVIPQLPPGSYRVRVSRDGFKMTSYTNIQIHPG